MNDASASILESPRVGLVLSKRALELCASDAQSTVESLNIWSSRVASNGRILLLGMGQDPQPRWVFKTERSAPQSSWLPRIEHDGLVYVARCMAGVEGFGSIEPMGYSDEERWLLVRYQSGVPLKSIFDRAIQGILGRQRDMAVALVQRLAQWLLQLRLISASPKSESFLVQDCVDRLEEIARHTNTLDSQTRNKLEKLIEELVDRVGPEADRVFPTHGDMAPQNFILSPRNELYSIDLEGFLFNSLDNDFALLRFRFEWDAMRRPWSRNRATHLWKAFCDAYVSPQRESFTLLAYLYKLLADVAWLEQRLSAGRPFVQSLRIKLRVRDRLRWMAQLPRSSTQAYQFLRGYL